MRLSPRVKPGGRGLLPCAFPPSSGLLPDTRKRACCGGPLDGDGDKACDVDTTIWTTETWSALGFRIDEPHHFGYELLSSGTLDKATVASSRRRPGLRRSELCGLKWSDIDLEERTLIVRRTVQRVRGRGLVSGNPKTEKSRRTVVLGDEVAGKLRRHRVRHLRWQNTPSKEGW